MSHMSPFAGSWYPAKAAELSALLAECFEEYRRRTGEAIFPNGLGFVVPHAAPEYSGTVAASVYRAIHAQRPERIVVLAFPHRGGLQGAAAPDVEAIATPPGEVAIDRDWSGEFTLAPEGRLCDHSFEIQLPFLQRCAPHARIAPLYVGRLEANGRGP